MKRIIKIDRVSAGGISLRVIFEGLGWLYGSEIKTYYASISSGENSVELNSAYFSTVQKAEEWLAELTAEIIEVKKNQDKLAKAFEILQTETIIP